MFFKKQYWSSGFDKKLWIFWWNINGWRKSVLKELDGILLSLVFFLFYCITRKDFLQRNLKDDWTWVNSKYRFYFVYLVIVRKFNKYLYCLPVSNWINSILFKSVFCIIKLIFIQKSHILELGILFSRYLCFNFLPRGKIRKQMQLSKNTKR